jgi:hypothetical protein
MSPFSDQRRDVTTTFSGSAAVVVRRLVTTVTMLIAGLTFAFSFGNIWALGLQLGVTGWVAPLVAPAVDLSVMALLTALAYLRSSGTSSNLTYARLLLVFSGVVTLALNTTASLLAGEFGRACFDAVAPLLLIGWSEVGPKLLAALHRTVPAEAASVPGPSSIIRDERPVVPAELVAQAKQIDAQHRKEHGRPISRDKLRAELKVSNAVAGAVLREVRISDLMKI